MATVNLGSIKFNWKGSYSGATAYVVDDVVESSGSSYICIAATTGNAPPNATYWEQMSQAGTDGTDLTTTLTTQGDIVYRDASGLARLGAGTAGQALITNGTGANPSWGDAGGGKILQVVEGAGVVDAQWNSTTNSYLNTGVYGTITPSATTSKILLMAQFGFETSAGGDSWYTFYRNANTTQGSSTGTNVNSSGVGQSQIYDNQISGFRMSAFIHWIDSPSSTSAITYALMVKTNTTNQFNGTVQRCFMNLVEIGA